MENEFKSITWEENGRSIKFVHEYEGTSIRTLAPILPLIANLEFVRIATHCGFCQKAVLRDNTIYIYCEFLEQPPRMHFPKSSRKIPISSETSFGTVREKEYLGRHPRIKEDITFIHPTEERKLGWYNKKRNILFLCDATHHRDTAVPNLEQILKVIMEK